MKRRAVLLSVTALVGASAVAGWSLTSPRDYIKHVIRDHFAGETLAEADLDRFAQDFLDRRPQWRSWELSLFGRMGRLGEATPVADRWAVRKMREDALRSFILGSNAMLRASPEEPVEYLAFPNPYESGCIPGWALA